MKVKTWYVYDDETEGTIECPELVLVKTMLYIKAEKGMRLVNKDTGEECIYAVIENNQKELYEELPGTDTCRQKH